MKVWALLDSKNLSTVVAKMAWEGLSCSFRVVRVLPGGEETSVCCSCRIRSMGRSSRSGTWSDSKGGSGTSDVRRLRERFVEG